MYAIHIRHLGSTGRIVLYYTHIDVCTYYSPYSTIHIRRIRMIWWCHTHHVILPAYRCMYISQPVSYFWWYTQSKNVDWMRVNVNVCVCVCVGVGVGVCVCACVCVWWGYRLKLRQSELQRGSYSGSTVLHPILSHRKHKTFTWEIIFSRVSETGLLYSGSMVLQRRLMPQKTQNTYLVKKLGSFTQAPRY